MSLQLFSYIKGHPTPKFDFSSMHSTCLVCYAWTTNYRTRNRMLRSQFIREACKSKNMLRLEAAARAYSLQPPLFLWSLAPVSYPVLHSGLLLDGLTCSGHWGKWLLVAHDVLGTVSGKKHLSNNSHYNWRLTMGNSTNRENTHNILVL